VPAASLDYSKARASLRNHFEGLIAALVATTSHREQPKWAQMSSIQQLERQTEAPLADFLLYFQRIGTVVWGIAVVLAVSTVYTGRENVWLFLFGGLLSLTAKHWQTRRSSLLVMLPPAMLFPFTPSGKHWAVFLFFVKSSLFVFGSGLAIVPFLHGGVVDTHHWLNEHQFLDAIAVAMIAPGLVVIIVAFIGYLADGLKGAILASLGVFLPVYLVIISMAPIYRCFSRNELIKAFVSGVTAAATGAIAGAVVILARHSVTDALTLAIAASSALLLWRWKVPEPIIVASAGALGLAISAVKGH
jgi:chromate transporter